MIILPNSKWIMENAQAINNCIKRSTKEKVNPSLIFDKYLIWEEYGRNLTLDKKITKKNRVDWDKNYCKQNHFKNICDIKNPLSVDQYEQMKKRKNSLPGTKSFYSHTKTRVVVNHGNESVLENSLALHPYYGFPVVPGSALKGVTRHFCDEFLDIDPKTINKIFGNSSNEGSIIFLDAWPENIINKFFEVDLFTQHYVEFYRKNDLPSDNQPTNPVNFLVVRRGIKFEFSIAPSSKCQKDDVKQLMIITQEHIIEAMRKFGVGAKTDSTYGYFN